MPCYTAYCSGKRAGTFLKQGKVLTHSLALLRRAGFQPKLVRSREELSSCRALRRSAFACNKMERCKAQTGYYPFFFFASLQGSYCSYCTERAFSSSLVTLHIVCMFVGQWAADAALPSPSLDWCRNASIRG